MMGLPVATPLYLDYAASTPVDAAVATVMADALRDPALAANPAAGTHGPGREAAARVEAARADVAALIGADPGEIIFTSGATEADNLAIIGAARFLAGRGRHLVSALTEHKAVLESCRYLAREGWRVTWLRPEADGRIDPAAVAAALEPGTVLVSLMHANNETGVVTDVAAIGALCRARGVLLHVDAAQSAGLLPIDVRAMQVDLLSLSAHKLYGPKGVGALFIDRERVRRVEPLLFGGGQERGLRPGTLPTHQIVGLGAACRIAGTRREADRRHVTALRDRLWARLAALPGVLPNGDPAGGTGHILNVSVAGVEGESLHAALAETLAVASGAACTSLTDEPSSVLRALGRSPALSRSSVRFSFGRDTAGADVDRAATCFETAVVALRALGPDGSPPDPPGPRPGSLLARGEAGNEDAGTRVLVVARILAGRITGLEVRVFGCPGTRAAGDRAVARLAGAPATDLAEVTLADLAGPADGPRAPAGRLLIVQDALRNCLADWDNARLKSAP